MGKIININTYKNQQWKINKPSSEELNKLNAIEEKIEAYAYISNIVVAHRMIRELRKAGISEEEIKEFEKKLGVSVTEISDEEIKNDKS